MAKITRVHQKQFGSNGSTTNFGQFGSKAADNPTYTKDPETIQALTAFLNGLTSAITPGNSPELEDDNGLWLLAFYQICYLFQMGIAEWNTSCTYYTGSVVMGSDAYLYSSKIDNNTGNNPVGGDGSKWARKIVMLDSSSKLPAVDGSLLTDLPRNIITKTNVGLGNVPNVDCSNAANLSSGELPDARLSTAITNAGRTYNAANKLVQLDGSTRLPAVSGELLTNVRLQSFVGSFAITSAGVKNITGIGFQPTAIIFLSGYGGDGPNLITIGFHGNNAVECSASHYNQSDGNTGGYISASEIINSDTNGGVRVAFSATPDSNGFSINVTAFNVASEWFGFIALR